jgi:elongation factor P
MKPATLETGVVVQVPLFIKEGDLVRITTSDKKYQERV